MKKTFKVIMRKTITFTQVIEVQAADDLNATDVAESYQRRQVGIRKRLYRFGLR